MGRKTKYPWYDDMSVVDNLIVRFYKRPETRLLLAIKARLEAMPTETASSATSNVFRWDMSRRERRR